MCNNLSIEKGCWFWPHCMWSSKICVIKTSNLNGITKFKAVIAHKIVLKSSNTNQTVQ